MSKVQGREMDLLNNLANRDVADELETRFRELERNIAVAREFIKLADESYSELRHKWNLLQQDMRGETEAEPREQTTPKKKMEERKRVPELPKAREKPRTQKTETETEDSDEPPTKLETHSRLAKPVKPGKKEAEDSTEDDGIPTFPMKSFRASRHKKKE